MLIAVKVSVSTFSKVEACLTVKSLLVSISGVFDNKSEKLMRKRGKIK